jgi:MerR family mercuric resistance operon transcriptional regulator
MPSLTIARQHVFAIGELSRRTGVRIETIRFYEKSGILPRARRGPTGRRLYGPPEERRLAFIRRARALGFSLDEVLALLKLAEPSRRSCAAASELAQTHLASVRSRLADLGRLEALLAGAVEQCSTGGGNDCPVLDMLEEGRAGHSP